jgi:hypothetical protein
MDIYNDELAGLLRAFYQNNVKYILVGGFATNLHGFTRITADIDIWIKDNLGNRKNLRKAIIALGIGDFESFETTELIPGWTSIYLDSGFELDIMTYIAGFDKESFDNCYEMAVEAIIAEIPIKFLHLNHLIDSKRIANRAKDILDISELEKIQQIQKEKGDQ